MGKDLKGKELGVGISQRKDGLYTARFTDKSGKRKQRYFKKLQECRNWLADAQFENEHGGINACGDMTVDAWFEYWINNVKCENIRYNTRRNYIQRYENNIKPIIGNMPLNNVKPLHCQNVLNQMAGEYANSTIGQSRITMCVLFESAVENGMLSKNPITKAVRCASGRKSKDRGALTIEEQSAFIRAIKGGSNYNQYVLVLQTGLRVGELTALKWSDIDFEKRVLHVSRSMEYVHSECSWKTGMTKSKSGNRDIPLTKEAVLVLKKQRKKIDGMKLVSMEFSGHVFLNRNGEPTKRSSYNKDLSRTAEKIGIKPFSMHTLRHTFATRCIEAGMKPKTLQAIMGHSDISTTMNMYVHVTEHERVREVEQIEGMLKLV